MITCLTRTLALARVGLALVAMLLCNVAHAHEFHPNAGRLHHPERGAHPDLASGGHDPYRIARNQRGAECCHGRDCAPYYGPPPVRSTNTAGRPGWLFAGKWFFEDDQELLPETIDPDRRGEAQLCISPHVGIGYCFWYPRQG
jgi:hypothetical protein